MAEAAATDVRCVRWKDAKRPEDVNHPERLPVSRTEMLSYLDALDRDARRHTLNGFWSMARKKPPVFRDWVCSMETANVLLDVEAGVFDDGD